MRKNSIEVPTNIIKRPIVLNNPIICNGNNNAMIRNRTNTRPRAIIRRNTMTRPTSSMRRPFSIGLLTRVIGTAGTRFLRTTHRTYTPRVGRTTSTCIRRLGRLARALIGISRRTRYVAHSSGRVSGLGHALANVGAVCRVRLGDVDARIDAVSRVGSRAHGVTHRVRRLGTVCGHVVRTVAIGVGRASNKVRLW